jgi:hypothetical protein
MGFLGFTAAMLCALWLGQLVPFLLGGELPDAVRRAGNGMVFVYVLDLGLVVPLAVLAIAWLRAREPWGLVLAGAVLLKAVTMSFALVGMTVFAWRAGQPVEAGMAGAWAVLVVGSTTITAWFLRHLRDEPR